MADIHVKAEKDYMNGMKYQDIADKYNVTINTVKSWKNRYGWNRKGCTQKKKKVCTQNLANKDTIFESKNDGTKQTLQNGELSTEQQMFCIYYSRTFNATQSYLNAYGCRYSTALTNGPALLGNTRIKSEIERLKEMKRQQIITGTSDIIELQMRIAFADIGNYLMFGRTEVLGKSGDMIEVNTVDLKESTGVDTQLISEVKEGRDGISVKLKDSQRALDWLARYFEMNPLDKHKIDYDNRKLELEIIKAEMLAKEGEHEEDQDTGNNFIDALNSNADEVWSDENESE